MNTCEVCKRKRITKGSIIGEFYYRTICTECYNQLNAHQSPSSGQAVYNRRLDQQDHEADIIQPRNGDGNASAEFIRLYPEQARTMFSDDEMNQATRS